MNFTHSQTTPSGVQADLLVVGVSTNAAKQRAFRARRAVRQCVADMRKGPR